MREIQIDNLYTAGGFINLPAVLALGYKYTIIISLRGGGKTYGALQEMIDSASRFMYFRRNDRSMKMCISPEFHLYKELNEVRGWDIRPRYDRDLGIGKFIQDNDVAGYVANLSTFASIRSIGNVRALGIKWLIFDEFIPQPDEVRRLLMANSDTIRGDIVAGYRIGDAYMMMQEEGIEALEYSPDMLLLRPGCAELAARKADTALYRVTAGSEFADVALHANFLIEDRPHIKRKNLQEYKAIAAINGICIYKHKARSEWYVSERISGKPKIYKAGEIDKARYMRENLPIWTAHLRNKIYYESLQAQTQFFKIYDI